MLLTICECESLLEYLNSRLGRHECDHSCRFTKGWLRKHVIKEMRNGML